MEINGIFIRTENSFPQLPKRVLRLVINKVASFFLPPDPDCRPRPGQVVRVLSQCASRDPPGRRYEAMNTIAAAVAIASRAMAPTLIMLLSILPGKEKARRL